MNCETVRERLSEFLDGYIVEGERRVVAEHLKLCAACRVRFGELERARFSLRAIQSLPVAPKLALNLQIIASRAAERRRFAGFAGTVRLLAQRATLFANNLMRPLAMPMVGGLAFSVMLFSMVMTNFRGIGGAPHPGDIPLTLVTDASVMSTPVGFDCEELTLDILVDEQGRVIDYSFPDGYGSVNTSTERRKMEQSLLFAQFKPATAFGQPTSGWVRISFRRSEIDVKG